MLLLQQPPSNISQNMLLMLPTPRFWKVVPNSLLADPKHMDWHLVSTQRVTNPFLDLRTTRFPGAIAKAKECADDLTISVIWQTDDADFRNGRVLQETFFDLSGEDVLAA
jgi:hypothetical protein